MSPSQLTTTTTRNDGHTWRSLVAYTGRPLRYAERSDQSYSDRRRDMEGGERGRIREPREESECPTEWGVSMSKRLTRHSGWSHYYCISNRTASAVVRIQPDATDTHPARSRPSTFFFYSAYRIDAAQCRNSVTNLCRLKHGQGFVHIQSSVGFLFAGRSIVKSCSTASVPVVLVGFT